MGFTKILIRHAAATATTFPYQEKSEWLTSNMFRDRQPVANFDEIYDFDWSILACFRVFETECL